MVVLYLGPNSLALMICLRSSAVAGPSLVHYRWHALGVQCGYQGFADTQFGDDFFSIQVRVLPEGGGGGADGFLVSGGKGSECVLYPVAQLAQHGVRDVRGVLGDKIDAYSLGADQPYHLFNFL